MSMIRDVDADGVVVEKTEVNNSPKSSTEGSVGTLKGLFEPVIGKALGIEGETELGKYRDEIKDILGYALTQVEGDPTMDKISWVVRDLDMRIGASPFAEKRIYKVARYIKLNKEKAEIDKKLEEYKQIWA